MKSENSAMNCSQAYTSWVLQTESPHQSHMSEIWSAAWVACSEFHTDRINMLEQNIRHLMEALRDMEDEKERILIDLHFLERGTK